MYNSIKLIALAFLIMCALLSCSIKGEEICGVWDVQMEDGHMKVEITPWQGKFYGYLLKYQGGGETITGGKEDEFIVMSDLAFDEGAYSEGVFYLDENPDHTCHITFKMSDKNHMIATYNCDGESYTEDWNRQGFGPLETIKREPAAKKSASKTNVATSETVPKPVVKSNPIDKGNQAKRDLKKEEASQKETMRKEAFNVIGIQEVVSYSDTKAVEKAMNDLWERAYNQDFSDKLDITEPMNMYLIYSNYDNPKGMMSMTLGYKVSALKQIPEGLIGIHVSANEYYLSPLSGKASDYEGEEWNEINELMAFRKAESVDFEVYIFDNNYEVTAANIWIAAK